MIGRSYSLQPVDPMTGRPLGPPVVVTPLQPSSAPPVDVPAPAPIAVQQLDVDPYPSGGTIEDVLAWVRYDPDRAKAATAAEHGRAKPRKSLLRELSERTS